MAVKRKKLKILYMMKIFSEQTDDQHGLTLAQINDALERYGIDAVTPKTLYGDIEELRQFGMDIEMEHEGRAYYYYLANRDFQLAELKLLVDTVQASRFLTERKSRALIKKLETLASAPQAMQLRRQVLISGRVKSMNESIYYAVDAIHAAIHQGSKVRFQYFQWNADKQQVLRHGGAWYEASPWGLMFDNENYYLIAYDSQDQKIKHFRVDKLLRLSATGAPREGREAYREADYEGKSVFGMFGGEITTVILEAESGMAGVLIDRFGRDIPMVHLDGNRIEARAEVVVSPQFFGWLFGLGPGIRIAGPMSVVARFREYLGKVSEQYDGPETRE